MSKYTAGPWAIKKSPFAVYNVDHGALTHHIVSGHIMIAALYAHHESHDARLIAAAPDLLEALECMIIGACAVAVPHNGERAVLQDAVNIARAAIAKANGEAP